MAKDGSLKDTLIMCRLTIAIAVQCDNNKRVIDKIQSLNETNQHYLMKAIEQVREPCRFLYLYFSPSIGHGQSSGFWRHPRRVDDDRVRAVHFLGVANLKTGFILTLAMTTTTTCSPTEVELSPRRKQLRRSTKTSSKNTAPYKPTTTMPSLKRTTRLLGCGRLNGKWKIPEKTTRLIMSCERRSTDYGQSCELFPSPGMLLR